MTNLITDDSILVELFAERLRLEYDGKTIKKTDLRQGCIRELEILKQLKDIEQQQAQAAVVQQPVESKSKKPPAKNVVTKGPDEVLKEELEAIRKMDVNGWILIGFPKTLA